MMTWISVNDKLPEYDAMCLVCNSKGWMRDIRALYHAREQTFILYDPNYRESLTLDVTHWMPLPELPKDIDDLD